MSLSEKRHETQCYVGGVCRNAYGHARLDFCRDAPEIRHLSHSTELAQFNILNLPNFMKCQPSDLHGKLDTLCFTRMCDETVQAAEASLKQRRTGGVGRRCEGAPPAHAPQGPPCAAGYEGRETLRYREHCCESLPPAEPSPAGVLLRDRAGSTR